MSRQIILNNSESPIVSSLKTMLAPLQQQLAMESQMKQIKGAIDAYEKEDSLSNLANLSLALGSEQSKAMGIGNILTQKVNKKDTQKSLKEALENPTVDSLAELMASVPASNMKDVVNLLFQLQGNPLPPEAGSSAWQAIQKQAFENQQRYSSEIQTAAKALPTIHKVQGILMDASKSLSEEQRDEVALLITSIPKEAFPNPNIYDSLKSAIKEGKSGIASWFSSKKNRDSLDAALYEFERQNYQNLFLGNLGSILNQFGLSQDEILRMRDNIIQDGGFLDNVVKQMRNGARGEDIVYSMLAQGSGNGNNVKPLYNPSNADVNPLYNSSNADVKPLYNQLALPSGSTTNETNVKPLYNPNNTDVNPLYNSSNANVNPLYNQLALPSGSTTNESNVNPLYNETTPDVKQLYNQINPESQSVQNPEQLLNNLSAALRGDAVNALPSPTVQNGQENGNLADNLSLALGKGSLPSPSFDMAGDSSGLRNAVRTGTEAGAHYLVTKGQVAGLHKAGEAYNAYRYGNAAKVGTEAAKVGTEVAKGGKAVKTGTKAAKAAKKGAQAAKIGVEAAKAAKTAKTGFNLAKWGAMASRGLAAINPVTLALMGADITLGHMQANKDKKRAEIRKALTSAPQTKKQEAQYKKLLSELAKGTGLTEEQLALYGKDKAITEQIEKHLNKKGVLDYIPTTNKIFDWLGQALDATIGGEGNDTLNAMASFAAIPSESVAKGVSKSAMSGQKIIESIGSKAGAKATGKAAIDFAKTTPNLAWQLGAKPYLAAKGSQYASEFTKNKLEDYLGDLGSGIAGSLAGLTVGGALHQSEDIVKDLRTRRGITQAEINLEQAKKPVEDPFKKIIPDEVGPGEMIVELQNIGMRPIAAVGEGKAGLLSSKKSRIDTKTEIDYKTHQHLMNKLGEATNITTNIAKAIERNKDRKSEFSKRVEQSQKTVTRMAHEELMEQEMIFREEGKKSLSNVMKNENLELADQIRTIITNMEMSEHGLDPETFVNEIGKLRNKINSLEGNKEKEYLRKGYMKIQSIFKSAIESIEDQGIGNLYKDILDNASDIRRYVEGKRAIDNLYLQGFSPKAWDKFLSEENFRNFIENFHHNRGDPTQGMELVETLIRMGRLHKGLSKIYGEESELPTPSMVMWESNAGGLDSLLSFVKKSINKKTRDKAIKLANPFERDLSQNVLESPVYKELTKVINKNAKERSDIAMEYGLEHRKARQKLREQTIERFKGDDSDTLLAQKQHYNKIINEENKKIKEAKEELEKTEYLIKSHEAEVKLAKKIAKLEPMSDKDSEIFGRAIAERAASKAVIAENKKYIKTKTDSLKKEYGDRITNKDIMEATEPYRKRIKEKENNIKVNDQIIKDLNEKYKDLNLEALRDIEAKYGKDLQEYYKWKMHLENAIKEHKRNGAAALRELDKLDSEWLQKRALEKALNYDDGAFD